ILDTRKTTPALRVLEKYAVLAGGATNHRMGLFDAILIKDNHVRLAGGVKAAVSQARARQPHMPVEVEAQNLAQVDEALCAGADIVLADNLSSDAARNLDLRAASRPAHCLPDVVNRQIDDVRETVRRAAGRAKVEISGGVTRQIVCKNDVGPSAQRLVHLGEILRLDFDGHVRLSGPRLRDRRLDAAGQTHVIVL